MKKDDNIKICREFMIPGNEVWRIAIHLEKSGSQLDKEIVVQSALRWGLKHPEELRKGK